MLRACFLRSGPARFLVGIVLFVAAVFACSILNDELRHREALAQIREDAAVRRYDMQRIQAELDAKPMPNGWATPASSAPPAATPAPVSAPRSVFVRRATPDPIAENEAIRAKYGAGR